MPTVGGSSYWRIKKLKEIQFGPAGYPEEARGNLERVFEILSKAGLSALEYAAVRGLRTKEDRAKLIGHLASKHDISMSMHAAYYISLASKTDETRERSKQRLVKALRFAPLMGVKRIVFHAGSYGGLPPEEAHGIIRDALQDVWDAAGKNTRSAFLAPEIAGKFNMYGSVDEIIRLCSEVDGCIPTIDWAHLYARSQGNINDRENYMAILRRFEDALGRQFVDNMHFHVSGIEYTKAGEARHQPLGKQWGPDILPLIGIISEVGYKPTFISETPEPIRGALYAKHLLEEWEQINR